MNRPFQNATRGIFTVALLATAFTAAHALPTAGPNRPAGVPANFLVTPFGYFHPSCVRQLAEGDVLLQDEKAIQHANGSFDSIPACAFPHFTSKGVKVAAGDDGAKQPTVDGWVEAVQDTTNSSYGELDDEWKVPPAPASHDGQTIYFFPGMQDLQDTKTIIQPVLGWNSDFANDWGIASWNCCTNGTTYESTAIRVQAGHTIWGGIVDTCKAGALACGSWDIVTLDKTTGKGVELKKTSSQGQKFDWAFSGVLEAYSVSKCSDYPVGGSLELTDVALYNDKFQKITPSWGVWKLWSDLKPQCDYGATHTSTKTTLKY